MNGPLYILFAIAIGCIIGWLIRSLRTVAPDLRVEQELRELLRTRDSELAHVRVEIVELSNKAAAADANRIAAQQALAETKQLQQQVVDLKNTNGKLEAEGKFLNERLTAEREQVERIQEKFRQEFEAVSNKLLLHSSNQFDEQSKKSLENVLEPFKRDLDHFKTTLDATRTETQTYSELLKVEVTRIGAEAANLSKALKGDAKVLGNWGKTCWIRFSINPDFSVAFIIEDRNTRQMKMVINVGSM
jgi:DNA recombination protein RmuC